MPPIGVYVDPHVGDHSSRENAHFALASIFGSGIIPSLSTDHQRAMSYEL
jgi:hypothetical protein